MHFSIKNCLMVIGAVAVLLATMLGGTPELVPLNQAVPLSPPVMSQNFAPQDLAPPDVGNPRANPVSIPDLQYYVSPTTMSYSATLNLLYAYVPVMLSAISGIFGGCLALWISQSGFDKNAELKDAAE